jgi:biotin carboxyl carrier protein
VDGEIFEVWPEETLIPSEQQQQITLSAVTPPAKSVEIDKPVSELTKKSKQIKAPIPGVISSININNGDEVNYGQELCVLEAMKMKNSIRANRDGIISKICVSVGDQVKHSQVLMEYQD